MNTPGIYDIEIIQGATFGMLIQWKDSNRTPIDLSDYSARMEVRRTPGTFEAGMTLTSQDGDIAMSPTSGEILIIASAAKTAALRSADAVYALEIEASNGWVTRLLEGAVTVSPEVTK